MGKCPRASRCLSRRGQRHERGRRPRADMGRPARFKNRMRQAPLDLACSRRLKRGRLAWRTTGRQRTDRAHRVRPQPTLLVRQLAFHPRQPCVSGVAGAISDTPSIGDRGVTASAKPCVRCGAAPWPAFPARAQAEPAEAACARLPRQDRFPAEPAWRTARVDGCVRPRAPHHRLRRNKDRPAPAPQWRRCPARSWCGGTGRADRAPSSGNSASIKNGVP